MTWIKTQGPSESPEVAAAMTDVLQQHPSEYHPHRRAERRVPDIVLNDSIVLAHSLAPNVLRHVFSAYAAMLDPALPLTRRQHEMIAAAVSSANRCFF